MGALGWLALYFAIGIVLAVWCVGTARAKNLPGDDKLFSALFVLAWPLALIYAVLPGFDDDEEDD